jgi:hypothetical protein
MIKESKGDNQVNEKKGKTYMRRSSTGKNKGRKACVFWCLHKKQGLGRQASKG